MYPQVFLLILVVFLCSVDGQKDAIIPTTSSCQRGQTVAMVLNEGKTVAVEVISNVTETLLSDCSHSCAKNDDCVGFDYSNFRCRHFSSFSPHFLTPSVQSNFFHKSCVSTNRVCLSPFIFDMRPQQILVGFAREVVPADSVADCFVACLHSLDQFGFECESVMFYPTDSECILNTEDRLDRPDLFIDETDDKVVYFDNNCAGSQCYAPFVTQYIRVKRQQLADELDLEVITDFRSCEYLCTERISKTGSDLNCKSFMHNRESRSCILSDERSKPLGRASLSPGIGYDYYEKKCFSSPRTCRNTPSFDRIPQMILVGFAAFVMENVPSVTMCLDQCTNPPPETGPDFECKSVMYYYNEQECILNAETRASKPDLFIPEGGDFQVDYFDILCHLDKETCPDGRQISAIKSMDRILPHGADDAHVIAVVTGSVADCRSKCLAFSPEKCRSFNYDKEVGICNLLYIDPVTLVLEFKSGIDHYELKCLTDDCPQGVDENSYILFANMRQAGKPMNKFDQSNPVALDECLHRCLAVSNCMGVNYRRIHGHCSLFSSLSSVVHSDQHVDFYQNVCFGNITVQKIVPPPKKTTTRPSFVHGVDAISEWDENVADKISIETICNMGSMQIKVHNKQRFTGAVFVKNKYDSCRVEVQNSKDGFLDLGSPLIGRTFGTEKQHNKQLLDVLTDRDCGIFMKTKDHYATTVVVQVNNLGIPGLVTSKDRLYEVSCDYSSMMGGRITADAVLSINGPSLAPIKPRGKIQLNTPIMMRMMSGGRTVQEPILKAKLGDLLELRWQMMDLHNQMDFFVSNCYAEPGGLTDGVPFNREKRQTEVDDYGSREEWRADEELIGGGGGGQKQNRLQLIEKGCPTPAVASKLMPEPIVSISRKIKTVKMRAFRFDTSHSIRLICHLEVCETGCNPTVCSSKNGDTVQSFGRKKRQTSPNDVDFHFETVETPEYILPMKPNASTSLMIVDELQSSDSLRQYHYSYLLQQRPVVSKSFSSNRQFLSKPDRMCLAKTTFIGLFVFVTTLVLVEIVVIAGCFIRRWTAFFPSKSF